MKEISVFIMDEIIILYVLISEIACVSQSTMLITSQWRVKRKTNESRE